MRALVCVAMRLVVDTLKYEQAGSSRGRGKWHARRLPVEADTEAAPAVSC